MDVFRKLKGEISKQWFINSIFTIIVSQIGLIIILFLVGPAKDISPFASISNYLTKGSLFLSTISIAANLVSIYFFDEREENKGLVFEISKKGLAFLIIIICSSGIAYSVLPVEFDVYFLIIQIVIFLTLVYWIFKINHIVHNKESYSTEVDKKSKEVMESAKKISSHDGVSF